jgi:NAD(P)-dependent dehydrogenase (short-subunit alcohol dehydrogenase family)
MTDLPGRVALVTGGGGGLGAAIAGRLAETGMGVVVADVDETRAEAVAGRLRAHGGKATALRVDVSRPADAEGALQATLGAHGRLDVLVNNAGVDRTAPFEELTLDDWDRILGVNLRGPLHMARAAFPVMRRQGAGHIVNIVSTAAKRAWPNASAYHASKWGLLGLSHALHVEGRPLGVKVTAVIAGGMRTPFLLDRFPDLDPATLQSPATVAEAVRFVVSQPAETVIPELTVIPTGETSWP